MKLLVVISSYRAKDLTLDCLHSLVNEVQQNPGVKVGICDNGNEDDTLEYLNREISENGWQEWAYVKHESPNRGFSAGNNVILNDALNSGEDYDYYLLLNSDTIVRPGALKLLIEAAECEVDIGIACPRLEYPNGEPQVSCFNYISPISQFIDAACTGPLTRMLKRWDVPLQPSDVPLEMEWGSFACALIKRDVLEKLGGLDEAYYLYFDDVDYCRMARDSGWKVKYFPGPRVVHLQGQSNPLEELTAKRKRRPAYWYQSRSWYFKKFYGMGGLFAGNMLWYAGRLISLLREVFGSKKPHVCEKEWIDIWQGFLKKSIVRQE